ncbi:hypothetical protein AB0O07_06275 [Streptomyces sp. NPDC093085]|uniref:hypothetical protein n=1 Tax=Streptomyces sp. NPDC093085 TaxID=3155068 RepID=UPI00342CED41
MTVRGWCRTVRAGVFAAACVLLAALAHATMSGVPVPWWTMGAGAAVTGVAGWLLAGRERGRTAIVTVVTAAQAVLHETFEQAQKFGSLPVSHPSDVPTGMASMDTHSMGATGMAPMAGMDGGAGAHALHGMAGPDLAHGMSGAASAGMFAAHLLAAVLCGLWLAHGERAVFRVLRAAAAWLVAPLRLLLVPPVAADRPAPHPRRTAADAPVSLLLCSSLTFRGPPAGAAVV